MHDEFEIPCCDIDSNNDKWYYRVLFQRQKETLRISLNSVPLFYQDEIIEAEALILEFSSLKVEEFIIEITKAIHDKDSSALLKILKPIIQKEKLYKNPLMNKLSSSKLSDVLYNYASYYPNLNESRIRYAFKSECDVCLHQAVSVKCTFCDYHYCWKCRKRLAKLVRRERKCFKCRNEYV